MIGWATGLTIGGDDSFSQDYKDLTKLLNLTHLLVVSGFQVSIFAAWAEIGLLKAGVGKKTRFSLTFLGLFVFVFIVGFEPPILRAMLSLFISQQILLWFGRKISSFRALVLSGLILLLLNPWWLYSYSFWLSFTTSLGLVIAYNQEYIMLNSRKWWQEVLLSSWVALVFSLPLIVDLNGGINLIGLVGNILIVPIIPFLTLFNILALVPVLGYFFAFISLHLQILLIFMTQFLSPFSLYLSLRSLSIFDKLLYYFLVVVSLISLQLLTIKLKSSKI